MSFKRYEFSQTTLDKIKPKLLYLTQSEYDSGWHSTNHYHQFMEIIFIYEGKGFLIIDSQNFKLTKGDFVVINPYTMHTEKSTTDFPMKYFILGIENVNFTNTIGYEDDEINNNKKQFLIYNYIEKVDEATDLMNNIVREFKQNLIYNEYIIHYELCLFIFEFLRRANLRLTENEVNKFSTKETAFVKQYLDTHFSLNITLDELAERTFISKFHLIRYFKKAYGLSPIEYLNKRRIEEAKFLLETTNISITSISNNVGFPSPSRFAERFKKSEGITPKDYRNIKKE